MYVVCGVCAVCTCSKGLCVDEELWHGTSEKSKVSSVPLLLHDPLHLNGKRPHRANYRHSKTHR
jgi:hypothetical protein